MGERDAGKSGVMKPPKVAVIGAGMVGASLAYTLMVERLSTEIILLDLNNDRATGEAMDIAHAVPFSAPTRISAGDYEACAGADVVVITAGVAQKPGETRLDLVARNVNILQDIASRVLKVAPDAIYLIVSNPVDVLTYAMMRRSGLPWQRVIGSGTVLDTARFRQELGTHVEVDPRNVHAYILGEHGDTETPVWSLANVAGIPMAEFCRTCSHACGGREMTAIFDRVRNAAYEIIRLKGATYYAVALGATRMIEAILRDQHTVMTASTLLQGQYGIHDVCLSLPVVLGRTGVQRVIEVGLSQTERKALEHSAQVLKSTLSRVGFEVKS